MAGTHQLAPAQKVETHVSTNKITGSHTRRLRMRPTGGPPAPAEVVVTLSDGELVVAGSVDSAGGNGAADTFRGSILQRYHKRTMPCHGAGGFESRVESREPEADREQESAEESESSCRLGCA